MNTEDGFEYGFNSPLPPAPIIPIHKFLRAGLIIVLFGATLSACLLAFLLRRIANISTGYPAKVFSLLSVFGGGVLLATCLLDLLPDAEKSLRKVEAMKKISYQYPVIEFLVAVGFLMILSTEQIIRFIRECQWFSFADLNQILDGHNDEPVADRLSANSDYENEVNLQSPTSSYSKIRIVLLVMALSLHGIFEGLSLGLLADVNEMLQIFFALLLHKIIVGFSLGLRLVQSTLTNATMLLCSLIFASQVILGGFGGIAILDLISHESLVFTDMVSAASQALACGTFLYITCFEILSNEFYQQEFRLIKLVFLMTGFALIASLMALFPNT